MLNSACVLLAPLISLPVSAPGWNAVEWERVRGSGSALCSSLFQEETTDRKSFLRAGCQLGASSVLVRDSDFGAEQRLPSAAKFDFSHRLT